MAQMTPQPEREILWDVLEACFVEHDAALNSHRQCAFSTVPFEQRPSFRVPIGGRNIDYIEAEEIVGSAIITYWLVRGMNWRCIIYPDGEAMPYFYSIGRFHGDKNEFERDLVAARLTY